MKVTVHNTTTVVPFNQPAVAAVFIFDDVAYIKVDTSSTHISALCLVTGKLVDFSSSTRVTAPKSAELIINL